MPSRKPTAAFWIVVAVVLLPVVYVASFGPACWFASRRFGELRTVPNIYRPIGGLGAAIGTGLPERLNPISVYATFGMRKGHTVIVPITAETALVIPKR